MRVNVGDAVRLETDQSMETLKNQAKKQGFAMPATRRIDDATFVAAIAGSTGDYEKIAKDYLGQFYMTKTADGLQFKMKPLAVTNIERDTVTHAVETIDNRVNALGVTEPFIARERQPHRHPASRCRRSGPRQRHHQDHRAASVPPRRRRAVIDS